MSRNEAGTHENGSDGGGGNAGGGGGGRRANSTGGDGSNQAQFECRLLIPSKMAGSIIGKKGANIQMLRTEYSANIRLPDSPGPERILSITTEDYEGACGVLEKALPFMFQDTSDKENEIRLLVHTGAVGAVIGKGGHKIKQIRELSGANIKAYQNCAPQSSERVISVKGEKEVMVVALRMCFQVIVENGQRGTGAPYDPAHYDAYFAHEYGGFGGVQGITGGGLMGGPHGPPMMGGSGGAGGGRLGNEGGGGRGGGRGMRGGGGGMPGRGGGPPPPPPPAGFAGGGGGFPHPHAGAGRPHPHHPPMGGRGFVGGGMDGFGGGGGGGGGRGAGGNDGSFGGGVRGGGVFVGNRRPPPAPDSHNMDDGPRDITQVTIPKMLAGAIIGPGGQRIRQIRNDSKASIVIEKAQPDSNDRLITIEGTEGQISVAQYLLKQAVKENRNMPPGGAFPPHRY